MWSGIYQQQINGRVWRYGQMHPVIIYHLLVCGTTDIVMNGMANEKNMLIAALVKAGKNSILEKFREVKEQDQDQDDPIEKNEDEEKEVEEAKKSAKGKKGKAVAKLAKSAKRHRQEVTEKEKEVPAVERSPPKKKSATLKTKASKKSVGDTAGK